MQTARGSREELLTLVDNIRHVEIIEDRRVGAGGCIVETDAGSIDARLETQLAEAANPSNSANSFHKLSILSRRPTRTVKTLL